MNNFIEKLHRLGRILEKNSFYILQILIILITRIILYYNSFIGVDVNIRSSVMKLRNNIIAQDLPNTKFIENKNNIVLIGIDEKFFTKENISIQGLHRGYYAKVIDNINKLNPSAVGIDVFFQKKYNFEGEDAKTKTLNKIFGMYDEELSNVLTGKNILACMKDFTNNIVLRPDNLFLKNNPGIGNIHNMSFINTNTLGILPSIQDPINGENIYPLSLQVFITSYLNNYNKRYIIEGQSSYEISQSENFLQIKLPKEDIIIPLNKNPENKEFIFTPFYITNQNQLKYISFYDAYKGDINQEDIEGKIVYIGATDLGLNDIKTTIFGELPGVLTHINQTLGIMNNDFLYILNETQIRIFIFTLIILNILIIAIFKNSRSNSHIFILLLIELLLLGLGGVFLSIAGVIGLANLKYSVFLPLGTISILISIQIIFSLIYSLMDTYSVKENLRKLFSLYVGEKITKKSIKDEFDLNKKSAEERKIAIFFSDIASFTNISEKLSPNENIDFLNEYLDAMSSCIAKTNGFIDKYIGDGIMAFWEDEKTCDMAAKSAIENVQILPEVNKKIRQKINITKEIQIRIGLHFGKVILGDIGSSNYKLNYTIIGDNVNLASRIEGINKYYKTQICMSKDFLDGIKHKDEFLYRKLDKITVKGKQLSVEIFELLPIFTKDLSSEKLTEIKEFIRNFEKGLNEYHLGNFQSALDIFENIVKTRQDEVSKLFITRCKYLVQNPPLEEWDGIWKFEEK